jgi:hypothetical protein
MLALTLIAASMAAAPATGYAPDSIDGKTLSYHIDSVTDVISGSTGPVLTSFTDGHYVDMQLWGVALDEGTYSYHRTGPNQGEMLLHPTQGQYAGGDFVERLNFKTATEGRAEGTLVKGGTAYTGSFTILTGKAADSLEGKTLTYRINKATGDFSADAGRALVVTFSNGRYVVTDVLGAVEDEGTYSYRQTSPDQAEVVYYPAGGKWQGGQYSEKLQFKTVHEGWASGTSSKGTDKYYGSFTVT